MTPYEELREKVRVREARLDAMAVEMGKLREQVATLTKDKADAWELIEEFRHENSAQRCQLAALTKERDGAVAIIEQTLCGISFGELRKAYAAYRAGEKYETVVDRIEVDLAAAQATNAKLREALGYVIKYRGAGPVVWEIVFDEVEKALALPFDTTALDERLAQERERICNVSGLCLSERQREIIRSMK